MSNTDHIQGVSGGAQNSIDIQVDRTGSGDREVIEEAAPGGGIITPAQDSSVLSLLAQLQRQVATTAAVIATPAAPTLSAPQSGGTLTTSAHTWAVVAVTDMGDSIPSATATATPTSGNQTIIASWAAQPGVIGWKVLRDGLLITAVTLPPSTLTLVDTGSVAGSAYTAATANPLAPVRVTNSQGVPLWVQQAGIVTAQPNAGIVVANVVTPSAFPVGSYTHPTAGVAVGGAKELQFYANITAIGASATVTFFLQRLEVDGTTWSTIWASPAFTTNGACIMSFGAGFPNVVPTLNTVPGSAGVCFGETVRMASTVAVAQSTYSVMAKALK